MSDEKYRGLAGPQEIASLKSFFFFFEAQLVA